MCDNFILLLLHKNGNHISQLDIFAVAEEEGEKKLFTLFLHFIFQFQRRTTSIYMYILV